MFELIDSIKPTRSANGSLERAGRNTFCNSIEAGGAFPQGVPSGTTRKKNQATVTEGMAVSDLSRGPKSRRPEGEPRGRSW